MNEQEESKARRLCFFWSPPPADMTTNQGEGMSVLSLEEMEEMRRRSAQQRWEEREAKSHAQKPKRQPRERPSFTDPTMSIVPLDDNIFTYKQWAALAQRYNYTCLCCKRREPEIKLVADHVIPLSKGGPNHIDNIQPLCRSCNSRKRSQSTDYR